MKLNYFFILPESSLPFILSNLIIGFFIGLVILIKFNFYFILLINIFFIIIIIFIWKNHILLESKIGFHTYFVQNGIKISFYYFLLTEIIFFFSIFWIYFDRSLVPLREIGENWVPYGLEKINPFGIPLLNSLVLLRRAIILTYSHFNFLSIKGNLKSLIITILLGLLFILLQIKEYKDIRFRISDSIFGRIFFFITGFHGFHVFLGIIFLLMNFIRLKKKEISYNHHIRFEFSIIYWHFVDVIWLYLYLFLYWWS